MKKLYFLLAIALTGMQSIFASGGCTIDTTNNSFFNPRPDTLPCVVRTVAYNQVVQIKVPSTVNLQDFGSPIPFILTVDSVVIDSITGFPTGITDTLNPANGHIHGGERACALIYGTTTDPVGHYPVLFHGTM